MFPDVEGQEGAEAVGDGIVGAGVLADGQGAGGIGLEPHPAGAEEADALGDELFLEGLEGAPRGFDLLAQRRFLHPFGVRNDSRRSELGEVQVVVQDLASVVEDGIAGRGRQ